MKVQDIKDGYFCFEILPKEICTLLKVVRVSLTFTEVIKKSCFENMNYGPIEGENLF